MENQTTGAMTVFMRQTVVKFKALSKNASRALYQKENENISLTAESWSMEDDAIQEEFNKNPDIVSQLLAKLRDAKDNEVDAIISHIRKYQRKGVIVQDFFSKPKVDEKTGEVVLDANGDVVTIPHVRFYDPTTDKPFVMGQAVIGGFFSDLEMNFKKEGSTIIGIAFDITYLGRKKNKKNSYKSDRFDIKASEYQPLQGE